MRALKILVNTVVLLVVLPVVIVGVLGFLFSPLQTSARATEPRVVLEANDLMLSEAVKEQVRQSEEMADQAEQPEEAILQEEQPVEASE